MSAVGTGAEVGIHPKSEWNNPEPEIVLVVRQPRPSRRRDARQRRQPARLRRPQRAAARQGQGQQRVLRDRAVHPALRRALHASTTCAQCDLAMHVDGPDGFALHRPQLDVADQPRPARARRRTRSAPIISTRTASCCSSARCSRRPSTASLPARASLTWSATSSRSTTPRLGRARQPRQSQRQDRAVDVRRRRADEAISRGAGCSDGAIARQKASHR